MRTWTLMLVSIAVSAASCGKSSDDKMDTQLQVAEATWASAKPSCADYHYAAQSSSVFGSRSTTTIEISGGQPVRRSFVGSGYGSSGTDAAPAETWDESSAAEVGTHTDGAPALTVEQLFASCESSLSQDPTQNTLTLVVGTDGVPTACGYTPKNCVDDCYNGFRLSDFACGPWPGDQAATN